MATEAPETPATPPLAITAEVLVPMERITNCLVGALEGGSTYWLRACDYIVTVGDEYESPRYADDHFWNDGGRVKLTYDNPDPAAEDDDGDQASKEIGLPELKAGLSIMAAKAAQHFGDLMAENDDAITHDVFIQCVLFGEIVYG